MQRRRGARLTLFSFRCGFDVVDMWWFMYRYELELRVCGRAEIDVDLLKRNTEYDDDVSENEPSIVWLWEVLEEFDHQQRCDFLRFVWARAHLPPTVAEFRQKFKIQSPVTDGARQTPDLYLPKAHTCFCTLIWLIWLVWLLLCFFIGS